MSSRNGGDYGMSTYWVPTVDEFKERGWRVSTMR